LYGQVINAAAAEHRRLPVGLGVPLNLEYVEFCPVTNLDD
jgi:hypothetical protein